VKVFYSVLAAGFVIALGAVPAKAGTIVTFSATDTTNLVDVSGSFTFDQTDMPVSGFNSLSSFTITFAPETNSTFPGATFTLASLADIEASSTPPPNPTFSYDDSNPDFPSLRFEADGTDTSSNYYGFYLYTGDGIGYSYGVDGVQEDGGLGSLTITESQTPTDTPEPATTAVLGVALSGLWLAKRRRRQAGPTI
jgi:hypothetical protein